MSDELWDFHGYTNERWLYGQCGIDFGADAEAF